MAGKSGESLVLKVPPGTQVWDCQSDELLLDLTEVGRRERLFKGGKGGLGNSHFKSSTNQRPTYAQPGEPGEERRVRLELKSIADVGLVGFPNVGKSTLISTLSHAKPRVADYEFTTLTPALGVVAVSEYSSFVMADIPGILDGASEGRGLGLEFLRHIERTRVLLYVLDAVSYRPLDQQYEALKEEIKRYSTELAMRPFGIVFTRVDADPQEAKDRIEAFLSDQGLGDTQSISFSQIALPLYQPEVAAEKKPVFALPISSVAGFNLKPLTYALEALVNQDRRDANRS
jgi:GTP-binding protein